MSTLRRACSTRRLASLAVVVVLPEPCRPTIMIGIGAGALRSTGSPRVPRVSISWSCTIFTTIWPGVTDLMTSTPTAWLFTLSTKARTTSSATSASSKARRTSRSAASTSASVNAPRRVKRSRMPPSLSESESNISCRCPAGLVLRDPPFGRSSGRGLTKHLRRPRAHCAVGRWPPASGAGRRVAFRLLARARGTYGCGGPKSRTPSFARFLLRPRSRLLAGSSSVTLDRRTRKRPAGNGRMPMQIMRVLLIALGLVGVCVDPTLSQPSAADYPNRQVNLIVPFSPGGGTDILGRLIGQKLSDRFGKSFVVENRPGAGTVTAAVQVAKSPPDGYTIMMATSGTMAMNTTLYKKLPYDPGKDLILVALVCNVPFVLVVNPALPVNSVADLVKLAKQQPLSYGSGGAGAFHHLMGELFKTTFGIPMTTVPYKGPLHTINDVIAGHIQLMFSDLAPAYPLIQAGKVRALGVTTAQRAAAAPDIPPLAEVGIPGFDWAAWQSVVAPGATPAEIIAKLNAAVNAAIAEPEVEKQLMGLQFIPRGKGSPEELDRFVKSETVRWAKVLQQAGVAGSE